MNFIKNEFKLIKNNKNNLNIIFSILISRSLRRRALPYLPRKLQRMIFARKLEM